MGLITTIHGCIFCYLGPIRMEEEAARLNHEATQALPEDDHYPKLTRNMFAITAMDYPEPGLYKYQMIHFGASMKDGGEVWDIWLRKFERLLGRMAWDKAELRLDVGGRIAGHDQEQFDFTWEKSDAGGEVQFSGGPRWFGEQLQRARDWVPKAEEELRASPSDVSLLIRLIHAYERVGENEKARNLCRNLEALDPQAAADIEWIDSDAAARVWEPVSNEPIIEWNAIDTQAELDALHGSVCWEDSQVLEVYAGRELLPGLPADISRSGYDHLNVYLLIAASGPQPGFLELAFVQCDRIGADAFQRLHLHGRIDSLKRVEVISGDGSTLLRCARLAYRLLMNTSEEGVHYAKVRSLK
jgi:hypothetical protein